MSHFTVAVITDRIDKLNKMLEPYDENMEVEAYIDETKEEIIKRAKERQDRIKKDEREGKEISEWEKPYLEAKNDEELYRTEIYDDEEYDGEGNHLSRYNPNSKWDWYEIGGRWRDILLTKESNMDCIEGRPMLAELIEGNIKKSDCIEGYKWCSASRIKDIDFKKMKEINKNYEKAIRFWEIVVEGQSLKENEEQPFNIYKKEYYTKRYGTKEHYAEIQDKFHTFAMLDENGWNEKGEMGWWACDNSTKESEEIYIEKFTETLEREENQDKYLIIVDCHI